MFQLDYEVWRPRVAIVAILSPKLQPTTAVERAHWTPDFFTVLLSVINLPYEQK